MSLLSFHPELIHWQYFVLQSATLPLLQCATGLPWCASVFPSLLGSAVCNYSMCGACLFSEEHMLE